MEESVSIIIVNYNGKRHLEKCLDSLLKINYQNYEIILVDNHSTDGSIEFIKEGYPHVKIIDLDKNYGFAEPNNIAVKTATGKYLHFLNNDTVVNPDFLSELIKTMEQDYNIAISQSMLFHPDGTIDSSGDYIDTLGMAYSSKNKPTSIQYILSARGASMMIRKDVFLELGGFDKEFFALYEDVDLGWKAWLHGYKVVLVPTSIVYHTGGQTTKEISSLLQFHGVKNSIIIRLTNLEFSFIIKVMIVFPFAKIMKKKSSTSVIKDPEIPFPSFKIIFKSMWWILKNIKYVLKKRRIVNANRHLSTNDLIKKGLVTKN